jgi:hypothetical protein
MYTAVDHSRREQYTISRGTETYSFEKLCQDTMHNIKTAFGNTFLGRNDSYRDLTMARDMWNNTGIAFRNSSHRRVETYNKFYNQHKNDYPGYTNIVSGHSQGGNNAA